MWVSWPVRISTSRPTELDPRRWRSEYPIAVGSRWIFAHGGYDELIEIQVESVEFHVAPVTLRMPFSFGAVTLRRIPLCTARLTIASGEGRVTVGHAADLLAPKWFEKDPDKTLDEDSDNLLREANAAAAALRGRRGRVFELWWQLYRERVPDPQATDAMVRGFGVTLCERALIDATCRAAGQSFFGALREDLFGFAPGVVHDELTDWSLRDSIGEKPTSTLHVRHTVGMVDPLSREDLSGDSGREAVDDGFPETLKDDIDHYGLRYFKLKIGGDPDADFDRLIRIGEVLSPCAPYEFTLDANEQYSDLASLRGLLDRLGDDAIGAPMLERLLFIEQPLPRSSTFDIHSRKDLAGVSEVTPVIIDEADCGIDAFRLAVGLGYRGVSIKNCKGVFRALINRGLCDVLEGDLFQSAEDLTNLPVVALQQDLATISALGVSHAERNGHHYFRGLDHLPAALAQAALAKHPDLYLAHGDGVAVRIEDGRLQVGSLLCPGYGYDGALDMSSITT